MPESIDWSKWLPPHPLPDTGPKEFRTGQVWAWHIDIESGNREVDRITNVSKRGITAETEILACVGIHNLHSTIFTDSPAANHAILIQDVDEAEPRDPRVLYTAMNDGHPVQCLWCSGDKIPYTYVCNNCCYTQSWIPLSEQWDKIRRATKPSTAPMSVSALFSPVATSPSTPIQIPCCSLERAIPRQGKGTAPTKVERCPFHRPEPKQMVPWEFLTDFDLLPDA